MSHTEAKQQAHELIDRMAPRQLAAVVGLLVTMLDPVSRAIANAAPDDEPESENERLAVSESKQWLSLHGAETIAHADLMREFGLSADDQT